MSNADTASKLRSLSIDRDDEDEHREGASSPRWVVVGLLGVIAALVLALLAAVFLRGGGQAAVAPGQQSDTPAPIQATPQAAASPSPVVRRPAGRLIASGYVVARQRATVSSDITGRIDEVLVEEGDRVEAGQILARLDDVRANIDLDLARARVEAADADISAITADLAEARRVRARARALLEANVSAEARVTEAQARVETLEAQLLRAEADRAGAVLDVKSREDLVDRHLVRAPFAGVVIDKNAQAGEIVSPTSAGGGFTRTGVYTLVDMDSLEIEVDVSEGSIDRIRPGMSAEAVLDAYADWRAPARVVAIIPTADRSRGTIQVRVAFEENDPRILPDMAAKVTFIEPENRE